MPPHIFKLVFWSSAIAFANTKGGSILLGVDRHGNPKSIDQNLKQLKQRDDQCDSVGTDHRTGGGAATTNVCIAARATLGLLHRQR